MKSFFRFLPVVLAFFVAAHACAADRYFPNDTTINYVIPSPNGAYVGYASFSDFIATENGTSPAVNLAPGGFIRGLYAYNSSVITVTGGVCTSNMGLYDTSTVNLFSGGVSSGALSTYNYSVANVFGGGVNSLHSFGNSTINVKNVRVGIDLTAKSYSTINLSGGNINIVVSSEYSVVNITGGAVIGDYYGENNGTLNFYGAGLKSVLSDPNVAGSSIYTLTGVLADGTNVTGKNIRLQNGTNAKFTLNAAVPEPGSIALFFSMTAAGGIMAFRRRGKRS